MFNKEETIKQYREKQEKYIYYIIALDVSSIAFSIYNTKDSSLDIIQIPLGIAVFLWGISIFFGLKFIRLSLSGLFTEYFFMETKDDKIFKSFDPIKQEEIKKVFRNRNEKDNKSGVFTERIMSTSFYLGIACYIIYHILGMYSR